MKRLGWLANYVKVGADMSRSFCWLLIPVLAGIPAVAQDSGLKITGAKTQSQEQCDPATAQNAAQNMDQAKQIAQWREVAAKGDGDAAFQLGVSYLIGNGVDQDAKGAEQFFKKAAMTPVRKCFVAEAYIESSLPGRLDEARKWLSSAQSGCGAWGLAQLYATGRLGSDAAKEIVLLKKILEARDDGFRRSARARLGEMILSGTAVAGSAAERASWIGEAARQKLGLQEQKIAWTYSRAPEQAETPETYLRWVRAAARYGTPDALAALGQAGAQREIGDISFLDGLAFLDLGRRQNTLASMGLEAQEKQLTPEEHEEMLNALAAWERKREETGGYYTKEDPLRFPAPIDMDALGRLATADNPDAELRLAYAYQSKGDLAGAEKLYRDVWRNGPAQLWVGLAAEAGKQGKWSWAMTLYANAAELGSRPACVEIARIDNEGLAGKKDLMGAYLWLLRSEIGDARVLAERKSKLDANQLKQVQVSQAQWLLDHQSLWKGDVNAAVETVAARQQPGSIGTLRLTPFAPPPPARELRLKADAGDKDAAYAYAIDLLWGTGGAPREPVATIEKYATMGAVTEDQKEHIADGYARSELFSDAIRRKYGEKWLKDIGGSRGYYELAKIYNGKSDGIVESADENLAVTYWQTAAKNGDERWARLSRMELGYRVVKGWTSGNKASDAAWAHELAMEMLGKEFYQIAGEYSYGRELAHDRATYLRLSERAAICNIDNAQGEVAKGILAGEWKQRDEIDAYAWMKLRSVKQDTSDRMQVETAEKNPELKQKIAVRYALLLKTRQESGAYYPQNDPMRTAALADLEARVKELDPEAQLRTGTLLEQQGSDAALMRAIELYRQIWATAGRETRLTWGRTLMTGRPAVPRDDVGAQKWLWDAANAGSREACKLLATIYGEGRGVKADPVAAETWRELAGDTSGAAKMTEDEKSAVAAQVADWKSKHSWW